MRLPYEPRRLERLLLLFASLVAGFVLPASASADTYPTRPIDFIVPSVRPTIEVKLAGQLQEAPPNLETLLFQPDENRASMTWRASLPCDRKVLKVENIVIKLRRSGGGA